MSVYNYSEYRTFLKDTFLFHKEKNGITFGKFAQQAGIKSRSFLRLVISGKRNLSEESARKVAVGFQLTQKETHGFLTLVRSNQASSISEKQVLWNTFLKNKPKDERFQIIRDSFSYLTKMKIPVLLMILKQTGILKSEEELCKLAGLPSKDLQESLQTLRRLNLVGQGTETTSLGESLLATTDDVQDVAIQAFHKNMLKEADSKLELPVDQRFFQSVLFGLNENECSEIKEKVLHFLNDLETTYGGRKVDSERIYAFNLNLIPLTHEFIRLKEKSAPEPDQHEDYKKENSL